MKKQILLVAMCCLLGTTTIWASNYFQVGDLYYNIIDENEVEVTYAIDDYGHRDRSGYDHLTTVKIPSSVTYDGTTYKVTSIGEYAFEDCKNLITVNIPDGVTIIGYGSFRGTNLITVNLPNSVTTIDAHAFSSCMNMTSINIPNSVTTIEHGAFTGCSSLTSIHIPNSVTYIGENAFGGCSNLSEINIPNNITTLESELFFGCSNIASIAIPNSVKRINSSAFRDCHKLENVIIGTGLVYVEERAFYDCSILENIICYAHKVPSVENESVFDFDDLNFNVTLYVPADMMQKYAAHKVWGKFNIEPIKTENVNVTIVAVNPQSNSADILWPAVANANSYEITITKNGTTICSLVFNSQGQLQSIVFQAPAVDRDTKQTESTGFKFNLMGLDEGTTYNYSIIAKDSSGKVISEETGTFRTAEASADALETVSSDNLNSTHKILENGQVLILTPDGKKYNLQGGEVQ